MVHLKMHPRISIRVSVCQLSVCLSIFCEERKPIRVCHESCNHTVIPSILMGPVFQLVRSYFCREFRLVFIESTDLVPQKLHRSCRLVRIGNANLENQSEQIFHLGFSAGLLLNAAPLADGSFPRL